MPMMSWPNSNVRESSLHTGGPARGPRKALVVGSAREKAPRLFVQELAAVVVKLRDGADDERQQYAARSGRIIWRILMPKTRNHVYYRLDDAAGQVEILLVWNAVAGATPDL
jgi:hypothetical protein